MEDKKREDFELEEENEHEEELTEEEHGHEEESDSDYIDGAIKEINISHEMKTSFLNYSMSVIVSRALPDVRDGLKPVQRRIIHAMNELGMYSNTTYKKSARIAGEVMGKYHPHGDSSIYDAMVRMAQPFSFRYPLVDGHGNFGSIDGDSAAAMRYTEARMSKISMELVRDLDKETVNFKDNYDASEKEPEVLPARYPNLLVNGASGIAVGMATNIPPHNLGEVVDGLIALMNNRDITIEELMKYIKGPDFPTGATLLGAAGLREGYETGNGSVTMRAKTKVIEGKANQRHSIIVTELPYQVNKSRLIDKIAELAKEKIVDGIVDLRDESNRDGMRIVIELRNDVNPYVMLNNLYKFTQLQSNFSMNMIALVGGEPKTLNLKEMLHYYLEHQIEVIQRKTAYELKKAEERKHIVEGLIIALEDINAVIEIIKNSKTTEEARITLMETYDLSDIQARAILDMTLRRLTGMEIEKIQEENIQLGEQIIDYNEILVSDERKHTIIKNDLLEIKDKYGDVRRSEVRFDIPLDIDDEDLIPVEDVIITITNKGYAKRIPAEEYKTQHRGGVGVTSIKMRDKDFVEHIQYTNTHNYHLFFTNKGRVYRVKGYEIPEGSRQARGLPINNILEFDSDEVMVAFTTVENFDDENLYIFFTTKKGIVKRTQVSDFKNIRRTGIIAIGLRDDDELFKVAITDGSSHVLLGASNGKAIRFKETDVRIMGRTAMGVKGMSLEESDEIVGMTYICSNEEEILVVTEKGYGKRSYANEYRLQNRGGKGLKALSITERNGNLTALRSVTEEEDVIIVSDKGMVIRIEANQISRTRRVTQGVRLINLRKDQKVATIAVVPKEDAEVLETTTNEQTFEEDME
jgi:DNA gyrase subunit A